MTSIEDDCDRHKVRKIKNPPKQVAQNQTILVYSTRAPFAHHHRNISIHSATSTRTYASVCGSFRQVLESESQYPTHLSANSRQHASFSNVAPPTPTTCSNAFKVRQHKPRNMHQPSVHLHKHSSEPLGCAILCLIAFPSLSVYVERTLWVD